MKNNIPSDQVIASALLQQLAGRRQFSQIMAERRSWNTTISTEHFNNADSLKAALIAKLPRDKNTASLVAQDTALTSRIPLKIFSIIKPSPVAQERSFGYEGLGSIYWHMVSKLVVLSVQETCLLRYSKQWSVMSLLWEGYLNITTKPTKVLVCTSHQILYGAVPTDPYSHTPCKAKGAHSNPV